MAESENADGEGKRGKFVRLAERRTANALRAVRVIGNLANRAHYEYSESDIRKITAALRKEVEGIERRFQDVGGKTKNEFRL